MKKKNDLLRLGLVGAGAIFLFNPTVNIVDPLPDFIGFWMIALGLTALAYLSEMLEEARKNFVYLAFLEAAKLAVCLALPGTTGTFVVLMTFVFSVAEAVLFIPAASKLFEGLTSLGMRYGSDSAFKVPPTPADARRIRKLEKKLSHADASDVKAIVKLRLRLDRAKRQKTVGTLKIFTVIAFCVRAACSLFPTLPSLGLYGDTLFVSQGMIDWSDYVGVFYILSWIIGFSVGIPWLRAFRRYFRELKGEATFVAPLWEKYEKDILSDTGRLCAERMRKVMILAVIAAALTFVFPVDNVNVLPNLLVAMALAGATLYLRSENKGLSVAALSSMGVWAVISAVGIWLQSDYRANNYDPAAAVSFGGEGRGMAKELYFRMEIFSYVEAALFLVSAILFGMLFLKALDRHIAMMPPRRDGKERDPRALKKCLIPVGICCGVEVLFSAALTFVTKYLAGAWIINMAAVSALFVFALLAYYKLSDRVYLPLKRKF